MASTGAEVAAQEAEAMHQASILFSALVMIMGGVWLAVHELAGQEASAEPAVVVAQAE
jgi:hypothetical protein